MTKELFEKIASGIVGINYDECEDTQIIEDKFYIMFGFEMKKGYHFIKEYESNVLAVSV